MKFSDYFHARGVRIVSLLFGGMVGLSTGLFTGWRIGVLAGAITAVLASLILPIRLYREDKPYLRIKEKINLPMLFDERVRFTIRNGTVGGYFILTQESMIFLSLENGDHRLELSRSDVQAIKLGENMTISIYLNNKQFIRVITGSCDQIYDILLENGWRAEE